MKSKILIILLLSALMMVACKGNDKIQENIQMETRIEQDTINEHTEKNDNENGEEMMINISINEQNYTAKLYDNPSVQAFIKSFPMTITMEDLHGNEKYYYMDNSLPTNSVAVNNIKTGDIMLFGANCLVLFYKNFNTSYTYTRLGYVENRERLAKTITNGSVKLTLTLEEETNGNN